MHCPKCHGRGEVLDTRTLDGQVIRRRRCLSQHRWVTVELLVPRAVTADLRGTKLNERVRKWLAEGAPE